MIGLFEQVLFDFTPGIYIILKARKTSFYLLHRIQYSLQFFLSKSALKKCHFLHFFEKILYSNYFNIFLFLTPARPFDIIVTIAVRMLLSMNLQKIFKKRSIYICNGRHLSDNVKEFNNFYCFNHIS